MSGGRFDYVGYRIQEGLESISDDSEVKRRWPKIARTLATLSEVLYKIEHDIDWDLSCDSHIEDDEKFDVTSVARIRRTTEG